MASVSFAGQDFAVRDRIGAMPLMRFAKIAKTGMDAGDMEALSVIYDLLQSTVAPADWQRFEQAAVDSGADGDELLAVVVDAVKVISGRPTSQPSDSSGGLRTTSPTYAVASSTPVIDRLSGRPDLQLMVRRATEARSA